VQSWAQRACGPLREPAWEALWYGVDSTVRKVRFARESNAIVETYIEYGSKEVEQGCELVRVALPTMLFEKLLGRNERHLIMSSPVSTNVHSPIVCARKMYHHDLEAATL
jgi:hypothetical protein